MAKVRTPTEYQLVAARIASRASKDRQFRERITRDPVRTLKQLGIGQDAVRELIMEEQGLRDRFASSAASLSCEVVSCICTSSCCLSCWVTTGLGGGSFTFGESDPGIPVSPERAKLLTRLVERGHIVVPRDV